MTNYRQPLRRKDTFRPPVRVRYSDRPGNSDYRPDRLTSTFMDEFDWMKRRQMPENSVSGLLPPEEVGWLSF